MSPSGPSRRRVAVLVTGAVLVQAAIVGGAVWAWQVRPWLDRGEVGEVLELAGILPIIDHEPLADDGEVDVALPVGVWTLRLATAQRLDGPDLIDGASGAADRAAPAGMEYLALGWSRTGSTRPGAGDLVSPLYEEPEPREVAAPSLTVRDAATDEVLGEPDLFAADLEPSAGGGSVEGEVPDGYAVLVPDDAEVVVDVEFDGATQTVDARSGEVDAGLAAPYYDELALDDPGDVSEALEARQELVPGECATSLDAPRGVTTTEPVCTLEHVARSPWTRELGWVDEPGQEWVAASLRVDVDLAAERPGESSSSSSRRTPG